MRGFIAYIDESGDDGIRTVYPTDPNGASEWFVLSAVVIRADREHEIVRAVRAIISSLNQNQLRYLHFRTLAPNKKVEVCKAVAALPIRCFTVISNKKNMRGYRNQRAEKVPARNWFYCWMTRLLLERVTDFCDRRSQFYFGEQRTVRLEFARRGGMSYEQLRAYMVWLRNQSHANALYLDTGDLAWPVVDEHDVAAFDPRTRAGLQLADVVSGAFFQAVDTNLPSGNQPKYAELLAPRMCLNSRGQVSGYSVKLMPRPQLAGLSPAQSQIFEFYARQGMGRRAPGP